MLHLAIEQLWVHYVCVGGGEGRSGEGEVVVEHETAIYIIHCSY